jgi:hypothetical protein
MTWWYIPVIPGLERWRQEDLKFNVIPAKVRETYLKNKRQKGWWHD